MSKSFELFFAIHRHKYTHIHIDVHIYKNSFIRYVSEVVTIELHKNIFIRFMLFLTWTQLNWTQIWYNFFPGSEIIILVHDFWRIFKCKHKLDHEYIYNNNFLLVIYIQFWIILSLIKLLIYQLRFHHSVINVNFYFVRRCDQSTISTYWYYFTLNLLICEIFVE